MNHSWDSLRLMRTQGVKPQSAVIVTTQEKLPARLAGVDALVILHKAGEVMPVKLLEGLDVIFMFEKCELAEKVWRMCEKNRCMPSSAKAFCKCVGITTVAPMSCDSHAAAMEAFGF